MAYAFRIHEPKTTVSGVTVAASTMSGWTATSEIKDSLLSNITIQSAHGKMGTSIPSIFARMFLFDIAFQSFNGRNFNDLNTPPENLKMEASLVSECLDLMEFLFQHGSDPKLVVKHWNSAAQIAALKASRLVEHRRLASVLEDEIANYPNMADIYLFYWKDSTPNSLQPQEFLIGGTSPMTLVFTAPNWKTTMSQNGFEFSRAGDGSKLFGNIPLSLTQRADNFKNMLYSLRMAFAHVLGMQAPNFEAYIAISYGGEPTNPDVVAMGASPASFYNKYHPINDINQAAIVSGGIPLCYEPISVVSGYEIKPTSNRYKSKNIYNGQPLPIPLMLEKNGLPANIVYVGSSPWRASTCIINEAAVRGQQLHKRELPGGMGVKYPFLIWSDLLEDKIFKVPYKINDDRFITATAGDAHYLLPLKREFFNYFEINDVNNMLSIVANGNKVDVTIKIPLNNNIHPYIDIKHTYNNENVVEVPLTIGLFPFYKTGTNDTYSILQCGKQKFDIRLYEVTGRVIATTQNVRTKETAGTYETRYHSVQGTFDIIEFTDNEHSACKGLIIPLMQQIIPGATDFKFSIDFGTSNTYIAYQTNLQLDPQTLEFGANDEQTGYLHAAGSLTGNLQTMSLNAFVREFTPSCIGSNARFHFPTTTATCELVPSDGITPNLFGTISMGFNMLHEMSAMANARYTTQLKWLLEKDPSNAHNNALILNYFTQILWMLKNKALQNGGNDNFTICLTFPETMPVPVKTALIGLWQTANNNLHLNCNINANYSESLAPYNIMVPNFGSSSFLNIDIGGGTHDILFVNRDETGQLISANYASARFAGDDLWGDGTIISDPPVLNNGFVSYLYDKIDADRNHYSVDVLRPLDTLKGGTANTSGDIMSYLFGHDSVFNTSSAIRANNKAYSLVFIHYMALMYHVARLIKKQGVPIPNYISFTGMGSKYMNLISPDANDIKALTKLLLEKYTGMKVPALFSIENNRPDAKEITAKGALTTPAAGFLIPANKLNAIVDYGFDTSDAVTYGDMRTVNVQNQLMAEYKRFLNSLQEKELAQFLHSTYNLTFDPAIINKLQLEAQKSYNTIANSIPAGFDTFEMSETLFFYPLKNALIECSKLINSNHVLGSSLFLLPNTN